MTVLAAEEAAGAASSARGARRGARAARTTGATGGRGRRPITPGMSSDEVNAELQARRVNAKHAARDRRDAAATAADPAEQPAPAPATPAPATSGPSLALPAAASTGSGFLLGVVLWAAGLAYLRGGAPEVRRLAAAKFLNRTSGAAR